jgi:uncharacterized membrane protein YbhN (UPF0104 family)
MAASTEANGQSGGILDVISKSVSLQVVILGAVLLTAAFGLDAVFGPHDAPPLIAIWGVAAMAIGTLAYAIIYIQKPN